MYSTDTVTYFANVLTDLVLREETLLVDHWGGYISNRSVLNSEFNASAVLKAKYQIVLTLKRHVTNKYVQNVYVWS